MASKNMYSWWWDSHISPKNSKWLQENLTDMDSKVKIMIKLIEVDEDSFARRAEMYYKKRPELMKLVEEFYRAYRALAERYDHATGVIRQAHKTMAEVFPNQVPSLLTGDEGPMGSGNGDSGPRTPEMPPRARAAFDPDELWGDAPGFSPSDFHSVRRTGVPTRDSGFQAGRNGRLEERRARKGLTFHEVEDQERKPQNNGASDPGAQPLSDSERLGKSEMDIQALKEALARLEAEKEAGLLQYQQSLARLSKLELEISRAQEDSKGLNERASKAEAEVKGLKGTLARVESEKENNLFQYQRCLERISTLESCISHAQEGAGLLNERACRAEDEAAALKEELAQLKSEKEAELAKYMEALEKIANLGNRLSLADDEATRTSQQADEAEKEVKELKQVVVRLTEEKESLALKYQRCLEMIADLEHKLALAQGEVEMLRSKIEEGAEKLKGAEEQCLLLERSNRSVQLELDTLVQKVGLQNQEISEKQKELGRLWTSVQEERLRFVETETAFHVLQNLHSQTQEELRSLGAELQRRVQLLNELEVNNQHLKGEVQMVRDENKNLSDANVSSAVSIQTMQDEVSNLRQEKGDLEGELELRLDQRNALQQEIECLKEELNDLKKKHYGVMGQMESVGLNSECLDSSVRELQKENHRLRESRDKNEAEIGALIEKLGVMEKLIDKNTHLEKTLSELSSDLEEAREKMRAVEESTQLLMGEKSTILDEKAALIYQLDKTTENLETLSERNTFLKNSLSDANAELEVLRLKTKNLEASCQALNDEKAALVDEKHTLASQLETACQKLEELGKRHAELEQKYSGLEQERDCTLLRLKEMQVSLENEKQAHATSAELSQKRLTDMENQVRALHKAGEQASFELEEELDKAVNAQLEIFILRKSVHDLKEKNSSLLLTCETLYEASKFSEKLISGLELENFDQQEEVRVLSDHIKRLRAGIVQLLKSLEIGGFIGFEDTQDYETALYHILSKVDDLKSSLSKAWDENQKLVIEKSVVLALFGSLKEEMGDLKSVVNSMRQDFRVGHDQLSSLQEDMQRLLESNEELLLCVREGHHKQEVFAAEMESLRGQLTDLQKAYHSLQEENRTIADEKRSLLKTVGHLGEEKYGLEKDNSLLISEVVRLDNLSLILKSSILEKCQEFINVKIMLHQTEEKLLEANAVTCDQKKQIAALSEKYNQQYEDCMQLQKSIQNLDAEVGRMQKQHEETEVKVEALNLELQTGRDEVKLWETVAGTFFCELQTSRVREALFKGKLSELTREYHILEDSSYSKGMDNVKLRDQIGDLEGENFEMRARLAAYVPVITSLKNCVDSMENHASLHVTSDRADIHVTEDAENGPQLYEHDRAQQPDGLFELQDVHTRIQAVEKAVIDMKRHAEEEYLDVSSKLEAATRQIELLKSHGSSSRRGGSKSSRRFSQPEVTKDIMLDHVSDSSYGKGKGGKNSDIDDHTLELWETLEQSSSIDLKVGKTHKAVPLSNGHSQVDALKEWKSRHHPSASDPLVEKELGVDKLEMSKRFTDSSRSEENDKNKLLERLASDVQKLTNLQITVNDLKNKVESTEGSGRGKGVEYVNVKEKLDETEKSILKLLDVSGKLMKNSEDCSSSFNGSASTADSAEVGASGRKRKISDQARRVSEKIGRLQLEVQKLQSLLLKLDDNKTGKGGTRITNTRVLLRDYLYSGARTPRRRRKARLCGCVQPPTSGD